MQIILVSEQLRFERMSTKDMHVLLIRDAVLFNMEHWAKVIEAISASSTGNGGNVLYLLCSAVPSGHTGLLTPER